QLTNADITSQSLSLLNVGDSVQFKAITKKEFIELGGVLNG
ncbi:allophanate hydrolase subunit 1, partial [Vibrio sp. 10N.261.48.A2]